MHPLQKLLLAITLCCAVGFSALAQSEGTRAIAWRTFSGPSPMAKSGSALPTFEEASFQGTDPLPYYQVSLPGVAVTSFEFTQLEFGPLTAPEVASFPKNSLKTEIQPTLSTGTANRIPGTLVSFQPFRLNPITGTPEKLLSFSYRYTSSAPAARKRPDQGALLRTYASSSVLSSGDWYKVGVTADGIYKLDRAALQAMGINPQGLNPKHLKIYGNGGGMLPQANSAPRPDDLVENDVLVVGEQDGTFDASDYILFYAQGPHSWSVNSGSAQAPFAHSFNLYSDTTYYYVTVNASNSGRITQQPSVAGTYPVISSYDAHWHHEVDLKNMLQSGREWYGEEFNSFTQHPAFALGASDLVPNSQVKITSSVMANSPASEGAVGAAFTVKINGLTVGEQAIFGRGTGNYHDEGVNSTQTFQVGLGSLSYGNDLSIGYSFDPKGNSSTIGYLNYFTVVAQRQLKLYGNQTNFRSLASLQNQVSTFQIAGVAADAQIWDVTDPLHPVQRLASYANGTASFSANSQQLREYVVLQGSNFPAPAFIGKVTNQNLHSLNTAGNLDFVIIAPPAFLPQAQRLAAHRRSKSNLAVEVVALPQVYEEFSSGRPDITAIRDFMKMLYERSNKQGDARMNLLLLGDASFDPKRRTPGNTNFIPVYQSRESLNPVNTYSSEDYFGFLDDTEGEWSEVSFSIAHRLDIGIGRLPAKTSAEADIMIDKILRYESSQTLGNWRKRLVFFADDGDSNEHLNDADYLAEYVERSHPAYLPQKVYLDLYPQVSVPNGKRSPETNKALREAVEKGALLVNYTGHGNAISLADEQILTLSEIQSWKNKDKLTFFLTATCDFGRYDDPKRNSGAETALLHAEGGAVGLLTTTRPVYSSGNRMLNIEFFNRLFKPLSNGKMPDMGYLISETKNNSQYHVNNRNFALLGDPSMRLAYPALDVAVSKINGNAYSTTASDTLKALSKITLEGMVRNNQQLASDFQGKVHISVYDKRSALTTLGDENAKRQVMSRNNVLYDGFASVRNGLFEVSFIVPKDINYVLGDGSIQMYAFSSDSDGSGASVVPVGDADATVEADNRPPQISLFMNDDSFVSGGTVNAEATLLAHLSDENGINTAGAGIGHEITAIIDDESSAPIVLNEFYTADVDSYQSGKVKYLLKNLAVGRHTLQVKAWDTHNNSNSARIDFVVASSEKLALNHVFNSPNPLTDQTTFHFNHNRPGQELDILIRIFTVSGKLVKTLQATSKGESHFSDLTWDGRDGSSGVLAKGVYIYHVNVRSRLDGSSTTEFKKLVLLK
ncbi:MAG: type IX secretion system sortase PorU [Rufibacter sp.]